MGTRTLTLEQILTPIEQASEQAAAAVAANTDILATILTPIAPPCLFRIQICVDTAARFRAMITRTVAGLTNTQPYIFNDDTDLTADAGYMFDLLVHANDTINFQFNVLVNNLRIFRVQEIGAGA